MYNITLEDYDTLFQLQGGVCAICGKPETSAKVSNLAVDHNHINGSIRGLLCNKCNRGLGYLSSSRYPDFLSTNSLFVCSAN